MNRIFLLPLCLFIFGSSFSFADYFTPETILRELPTAITKQFADADNLPEIDSINWVSDYDKALRIARSENKPLFLYFGGRGRSEGGRAWENTIFKDKLFIRFSQNFICYAGIVPVPYEVDSLPRIFIVDPSLQIHLELYNVPPYKPINLMIKQYDTEWMLRRLRKYPSVPKRLRRKFFGFFGSPGFHFKITRGITKEVVIKRLGQPHVTIRRDKTKDILFCRRFGSKEYEMPWRLNDNNEKLYRVADFALDRESVNDISNELLIFRWLNPLEFTGYVFIDGKNKVEYYFAR